MKYKPRPGVVMTSVCGTKLLVPDRIASEACPYILRLSFLYAAEWRALADKKPINDIYKAHSIVTKKPLEEAIVDVDEFFEDLYEKGFLIPVEDEDDPE